MRKNVDERLPKVRLCSKCHVGIPHWLTNGHGSDFVKCENCGNEIQVPYCCRNYWTLWNKENKDGVLVSYTPSFGIRQNRTILDLAPKWEYESEQLRHMKRKSGCFTTMSSTTKGFHILTHWWDLIFAY